MLEINPIQRWLINYQPRPEAKIRLICAHHAGGSAQYFEEWPTALPDHIEILGVNLPGRASRRNETLVRDIGSVVDAICTNLTPCFDRPYAMFGDSIGALVCFEVIRELRRRGELLPLRLFASGMVAPHIVWWNPDAPLHRMEDVALFEGLVRDAGMLDETTLSNADLREVMTPVLRADLQIAETYSFVEESSLELPITALRGDADTLLTPDQLHGWSSHTSESFEHLTFPGTHFYSRQSQNELVSAICKSARSTGVITSRKSALDSVVSSSIPASRTSPSKRATSSIRCSGASGFHQTICGATMPEANKRSGNSSPRRRNSRITSKQTSAPMLSPNIA